MKTPFKVGNYVTRGNLEATLFMIDNNANYPLIGAIKCQAGWYIPACWDIEGKIYDPDSTFESYWEDDIEHSEGDIYL